MNGTFGQPEPLPKNRKAVKSKWVFKTKYLQDNSIDKYKARLCAKGYTQKEGMDFEEIFAPVVSIISLRIILSLAVKLDFSITIYDITGAYLYPYLDKELYMEIPLGFKGEYKEGEVLRLLKGLYGLKQSGKLWYEDLKDTLTDMNFSQSHFDGGVYFKTTDHGFIVVCVYVDDLLVT